MNYINFIFYSVLLIFGFGGCYSQTNSDKLVCSEFQINPQYEFYTNIISLKETTYIIGEGDYQNDFRAKESILYRIDEKNTSIERNPVLLDLRLHGSNTAYSLTTNNAYLVNEIYYEKSSLENFRSVVFKMDLETEEVKEIGSFKNLLVKNIFFDDDSTGFIFVRLSNFAKDGGLLKTENGGKTWDTVLLSRPIIKAQSQNGSLFFLSYKRNNIFDWIYTVDKKSYALDSLRFEMNIIDFQVDENANYWLLGKDVDRTVLQWHQSGKTRDVYTFSKNPEFFPVQLYKFNDVIIVISGKVDKNLLGGFGGIMYEMFLSKDNGLSWSKHSFNESFYLKPVSFYKDRRMTVYLGHGKLLSCILNDN
jgi:hypothetical protein